MQLENLRKKHIDYIVATLKYVADNIEQYVPDEILMNGSEFVVRIPDMNTIPTVELDAQMPAIAIPPTRE